MPLRIYYELVESGWDRLMRGGMPSVGVIVFRMPNMWNLPQTVGVHANYVAVVELVGVSGLV